MNSRIVKLRLLERDKKLIDLSRTAKIPYDRLVRVVNGYRRPSEDEIQLIARLLCLDPDELRAESLNVPSDDPQVA